MKRFFGVLMCLILLISQGNSIQAQSFEAEVPINNEDGTEVESELISEQEDVEAIAVDNAWEESGSTQMYEDKLVEAYIELTEYCEENELEILMSLDQFCEGYQSGNYESVEEYKDVYMELLDADAISAQASTDQTHWYYNTGTDVPQAPNYSKYNLLQVVQKGDIIYEAEGGSGITGHISIVEGIYYSTKYSQFYIRLIESIGYISGIGQADGVCRSILDDERYDNRDATVLRVNSATSSQKSSAVSFCVNQIGKDYLLKRIKESDPDTSKWYCSELVWAAYHNQGIELVENDSDEDEGYFSLVRPKELLESDKTSSVTVKTIATPTISSITINSATSVTIAWSKVSGASLYYIYRATSVGGTYSLIGSSTTTSYTNGDLTSGSTYYYRVAAYISGTGNKSPVKGVTLSFAKPTVYRVNAENASVSLEWTKVYTGTTYLIMRTTDVSNGYSKVGQTTGTTFTDTTAVNGTLYYYMIFAYSSTGASLGSANYQAQPSKVGTPGIYYVISENASNVTLKWTHVEGASFYSIYRGSAPTSVYTRIGDSEKTEYTDSGLTSGYRYYYRVRAYKDGAYSNDSNYYPILVQ